MENATKALLIAGSVLVVIAIITLGVGFLTSAEEQMGNADLSEYQVNQFNDKFRKYEGTDVTGTEVNALLETVFNHNNAQPDTTTCVQVTGKATVAKDNKITKSPTKVSTAAKFTVTATYNTTTKLIEKIEVK